jgi:hypothetical protein
MCWLTSWSNSKCALSIVNLCAGLSLGSRVPARGVLGATQQSSARFQVSRSALEERLAQPSAETSNTNNPSLPFFLPYPACF